MKNNTEKTNLIAQKIAEVVKEAIEEDPEKVLIGEVEMAMREGLQEIGQQALKCLLENADGEAEAEIEGTCGGKLAYQRQRKATIWSVFGKVSRLSSSGFGWIQIRRIWAETDRERLAGCARKTGF